MAGITRGHCHKVLILRLLPLGMILPVSSLYIFYESFKGHIVVALSPFSFIMHRHFPAVRTVDEHVLNLFRKVLERCVKVKPIFLRQRVKDRSRVAFRVGAGLPSKDGDGSLGNTQTLIRNHQIHVKLHLESQSVTDRAGAKWIIERKTSRLNLVNADAAVRAGKTLTEIHRLSVGIHQKKTAGQSHDRLHGICQSLLNPFLHDQTVHHDLYVMLFIFFQLDLLGQIVQISVNAYPDIAAASGVVQYLHMLAFSAPHNRRQKLDLCPLRQSHQSIHDLIYGLLRNDLATFRTVGNPHPGIKQTEIIIDLRHCSHRGAGIPVGRLLIDGDGRRQSLDIIHIRLLHLSQKLSGVRRQRLHVSPLPLCVNRVKGERRLAGAAQSRQHHKFISRYIYINILQVMLSGSPNPNIFFFFAHVYLLI